jgi:hypothetical protein
MYLVVPFCYYDLMNHEKIDHCIETLSLRGCTEVCEVIRLLEEGEALPETAELNDDEREAVLNELKAVMAIYTERKGPAF